MLKPDEVEQKIENLEKRVALLERALALKFNQDIAQVQRAESDIKHLLAWAKNDETKD